MIRDYEYLKAFSKLARGSTAIGIDHSEVKEKLKANGVNDEDIRDTEQYLLSEEYLIWIPGPKTSFLSEQRLTSKALQFLGRNSLWGKTRRLLARNFKSLADLGRTKAMLYGAILFVLFLAFEPFIVKHIDKFWVKGVLVHLERSKWFDLAFIAVVVILTIKSFRRKLTPWDVAVILVYLRLRHEGTWEYYKLFEDWKFLPPLHYIDFVPAYYFIVMIGYPIYSVWNHFRKNPDIDTSRLESKNGLLQALLKKLEERWSRSSGNPFAEVLLISCRAILYKAGPVFRDGVLSLDMPIDKEAHKNNELKNLAKYDQLNRMKFAAQIASVIEKMRPFKAFAIGINGPWGSGKTSLVSLIKERLMKGSEKDNIVYIDFYPWFFNNTESLITNFFLVLEERFSRNRRLATELRAYAKEIAKVQKNLFPTVISDLLLKENPGLYDRYEKIIEEILLENKLVIVSIDDLDRLDKKEVIEVLRLIRLLADFPNTFYVVGYDRGYINAAIRQQVTDHNPDKYIDKVINIEFKVPEMPEALIKKRLRSFMEKMRKTLEAQGKKINDEQFERCLQYGELDRFIENDRDVRRFSNNLIMRYMAVTDDVNFYQFFLLELLNYKYPDIHKNAYLNHSELKQAFEQHQPPIEVM